MVIGRPYGAESLTTLSNDSWPSSTDSWRYQNDLLAAARERDGAAAQSVSDASLDNATQRIRALLAAQKEESAGAL